MSAEKNRQEAARWLQTGQGDLDTANILLANDRFAHACFHAQQAGEKALKALWYYKDRDPWGHSVHKLIEDLSAIQVDAYQALKEMSGEGAKLDRFYIPTRYPNSLPEITPEMAYFEEDAQTAINAAQKILALVRSLIESENGDETPKEQEND